MSSNATENPVLLWGDMGPDVYILSQIYDPRNDRYVETQDTSLKPGKVYYERLQLILTSDTEVHPNRKYFERVMDVTTMDVKFVPVTPAKGDNPAKKGWYMDSGGKIYVFSMVDLSKYPPTVNPRHPGDDQVTWFEINPDAQNTCGKYVPAVNSLVVVDELTCDYKVENNYKTRMILIVKSVDAIFNVTFACAEFGLNTEDTTRSIDYGNEKFYLFFDRKETGRNIRLTPDRKLMLYGKNSYGYRLKRDGAIISTNIPVIQTKEDAFVPYARATGKRVRITKDNYDELKGAYIDVLLPNGLQRVMQLPEDTTTVVPTFDITFRKGVRYYTTKDGVLVGTLLNTDGLCGEIIDPSNDYDVGIVDESGTPVLFHTFYEKTGETTYVETTDRIFDPDKQYYVFYKDEYREAVTAKLTGVRILDWEESDPEGRTVCRCVAQDRLTKEWDGDVLGRVVFVHQNAQEAVGSVFLPHPCYLKSNHSIVEGESILMEIFSFDYQKNQAQLIMSLQVLAKEATALDTTDVTTRQIVRFDVELNGSDTAGDIWYLQQGQDWREVFDIVPKISFDDGSDITIPVDNRTCYAYGFENIKAGVVGREYQVLFKFFPHKTLHVDWQKIGLTPTKNYLSVRKTVKIINDLSQTIRKISLIPAWNYPNQEYDLYFMIFRTDFAAPPITRQDLDTKYSIQTYTPTTDEYATEYSTGPHASELKHYFYKVNTGNFIDLNLHKGDPIQPERERYGEVYEKQELPKTTIEDVQYMNENGDIEYVPAASVGKLSYIQRGLLAERVAINNQTAASIYTQPILFKLAPMDFNSDPFKWLIGDDKTGYQFEQIPYGKSPRPFLRWKAEDVEQTNEDGSTEVVKTGSYRIDPGKFATVEQVLKAFYEAGNPPHGVSEEGVVDDQEFTPTHFYLRACTDDSACSGFIALRDPTDGDKGDNYRAAALMAGGGRADEVAGGAIPVTIDDPVYGQGKVNLMGTVIMEFVHRYVNPDSPSQFLYKHLWAVPVEVIDETWPRDKDL